MVHMVNGTPTDSIIYSKNRQFRSGVNMKTGRCCCDSVFSQRRTVYVYEQPKIPTAAKVGMWAMAIGFIAKAATSVVNFFTGIFGKKKASAPVQTPAATQNNQVTDKQGVNTPTSPIATPQKATTPQEVNDPEKNNNKKQTKEKKYKVPSSVDMKKFNGNITVHDDELFEKLGDKSDITGKTTVSKEIGQGGYPKELKVGNYKYTLERVDADGTVWYKSQNGNKQLYRLEKNNNNTYGLNQHAEDDGVGKADVSKWKKTTPTSSKKTQTPASTTTTTTTSTNNTQSTTTQANASQQKTTSTDKKTPASTSIRTDEELKDTMSIGREISDFKNTKWGTEKTYSPMTVTYGYSPEMQTVEISAEEVAKCQGDEAKIKDLALQKIREKEQQESKKTK